MHEHLLISLTSIVFLGVLAQWLAWKINIPSILPLLLFGFLGGPITGFIDPDALFGPTLFPFVSIAVAIILYEGGLTLRLSEIRAVGKVVRNLVSIGALVTWALAATAAYTILSLSLPLSILLGSILVVTGPTVIMPLLRLVRPKSNINSILKWEGMLNDPIGAILAVLVFESILASGFREITILATVGILTMILVGGGMGFLSGYLMKLLLQHRWIPDYLQNAISIAIVILVFTASNLVQAESGLLAVTVMGIVLANQKTVTVTHIIEFKENLRVLLLSVLFIVLAARLQISDLSTLGLNSFIFLAVLMLLVRPAAVFISTIGSELPLAERAFLAWMAPRGIVAAAVSSLFALQLTEAGVSGADQLLPLTFLVIVGTISIYGLSALPLARWLKLSDPGTKGFLILGANRFGRELGKALQEAGLRILLLDTNWSNISKSRMSGLQGFCNSGLSDAIDEEIELAGMGHLIALTPNNEVNSLAAIHFKKYFGADHVYQLSHENDVRQEDLRSGTLQGNILFGAQYSFDYFAERLRNGAVVKLTQITEEFDVAAFEEVNRKLNSVPLFLVKKGGEVSAYTEKSRPTPQPGDYIIHLVDEPQAVAEPA